MYACAVVLYANSSATSTVPAVNENYDYIAPLLDDSGIPGGCKLANFSGSMIFRSEYCKDFIGDGMQLVEHRATNFASISWATLYNGLGGGSGSTFINSSGINEWRDDATQLWASNPAGTGTWIPIERFTKSQLNANSFEGRGVAGWWMFRIKAWGGAPGTLKGFSFRLVCHQ